MSMQEMVNTDLLNPGIIKDEFYDNSPEMFLSVCSNSATILYCNKTLCETVGYKREDLIGKSVFDLYHTSCYQKVKEVFQPFLFEEKIENVELVVRKRNGDTFPILLNIKIIKDDEGNTLYSNSCWRDITLLEDNFKKSNKLLNQKVKELAQKNKELEQFAYIVSHDLNTPLRNIKGVVNLMKEDKEEQIPTSWNTYFDYMTQSVGRMGRLINTILEFSQLGIKSEKEVIDTHKILNNVLDDFTLVIEESKVQLFKTMLPKINGYAVEFHMLLQNLIGNAIKFQNKDITPILKIGATDKGSKWLFYVKDNGIGIDVEHKEKVFSFFKRMNEDFRGTGIGLAQCKKIIELHGGRIWVERNEREGSCFYFTIPKS